MSIRPNRYYALWALLLLLVETGIALWVHDRLIRPFIGDLLVIWLLYALLRSLFVVRHRTAVIGIWLFALGVELAQGADLVSHLGLADQRWARILIGTTFDVRDLLAYSAGALLLLLWPTWLGRR